MLRKFSDLLQYWLIRIASWIICLIPFRTALAIAKPVGKILFLLLKRSRQRAYQNLKHAFPEKSEEEIKRILKESFVHLAEFGIEWLKMPEMIKHPKKYLIDEIAGKDRIFAELNKKKGAVVLVTHTANWEVMALVMGGMLAQKSPVYAVARSFKNGYLYRHAMKLRAGQGLKTINKVGGVRETFDRLIKENAVVCMLIDQRISEGSVEVNFFGRLALTTTLPIIAALRLGTPIFFSFMYQTKDLRYEVKLEGPLILDRTGDFKSHILSNTQNFTLRVEEEIKNNPPHWLWMHNRWRVPHGAKD